MRVPAESDSVLPTGVPRRSSPGPARDVASLRSVRPGDVRLGVEWCVPWSRTDGDRHVSLLRLQGSRPPPLHRWAGTSCLVPGRGSCDAPSRSTYRNARIVPSDGAWRPQSCVRAAPAASRPRPGRDRPLRRVQPGVIASMDHADGPPHPSRPVPRRDDVALDGHAPGESVVGAMSDAGRAIRTTGTCTPERASSCRRCAGRDAT